MRLPALLLLIACLAGCSRHTGEQGKNEAARASPARGWFGPSRIDTLTGLYQGGGGTGHSRLCIIAGSRSSRFGLVLVGAGAATCSGSGTVSRERGGLRFTMTGDSACSVHATISGRTIVFGSSVPSGCGYYCGGGASLGGARLTQTQATRQAAMKAADLVGEPLCASE